MNKTHTFSSHRQLPGPDKPELTLSAQCLPNNIFDDGSEYGSATLKKFLGDLQLTFLFELKPHKHFKGGIERFMSRNSSRFPKTRGSSHADV